MHNVPDPSMCTLSELEAVTNRSDVNVPQDANGVLQYSSTAEGMWQNPGY